MGNRADGLDTTTAGALPGGTQRPIKVATDGSIEAPAASGVNIPPLTVTTSAQALTTSTKLARGVILQADPSNAVTLYVGFAGVTPSSGLALPASASVTIAVDDAAKIFAICASGAPVLRAIAL